MVNASSGTSVPSIAILLNKGDGPRLACPSTPLRRRNGQSITTGDLNSDGNVDIWVGAPGRRSLMLGNGETARSARLSHI